MRRRTWVDLRIESVRDLMNLNASWTAARKAGIELVVRTMIFIWMLSL
ncbi:MAG TPA: hypothetical protein VLX61_00735 [Anaerolineales bacterium]|nr:hypothetical protein [Anaerolineales bacterium]